MKKDIHPKYHKDAKITCSCGNVIIAGATVEAMHTDICSACHPFYTGKQKLVDSAGRVEKFEAKRKNAQAKKEKEEAEIEKKEEKKAKIEGKKKKKPVEKEEVVEEDKEETTEETPAEEAPTEEEEKEAA